jgi:hypothetical protein
MDWMRIGALIAAVLKLGLLAYRQPVPNPYPFPPIGPTDPRQCDAYQQRVSEIKANYDQQHNACLSANSRSPTVPTSEILICSRSACQSLHDIVYGDFFARADDAVKACREQVQMYEHALDSVRAAGEHQGQIIQAQGDAQIASIDVRRNTIDQQRDQVARQADLNRQRAADAERLAEIYRQQSEATGRERPEVSGSQLSSLDSAQRRIEDLRAGSDPASTGPSVAVDRSRADFRDLVSAAKERILDGFVTALRSTGERGAQIADVIENAQSWRQTWDAFTTLGKSDASTDQQLDSIRDLVDQANDKSNTNAVSRFLFSKLLSGGIIEPNSRAMADFDALRSSDVPMSEVNDFLATDDPGRYFPDLRKWAQTSTTYRTVDKFRQVLGIGK